MEEDADMKLSEKEMQALVIAERVLRKLKVSEIRFGETASYMEDDDGDEIALPNPTAIRVEAEGGPVYNCSLLAFVRDLP